MTRIRDGVSFSEHGTAREPVTERVQEDIAEAFGDLIEVETATAKSCKTALKRLDAASRIGVVAKILSSHRRHIEALERMMTKLGGKHGRTSAYRQLLGKGRVVVHQLEGDPGIVGALRKNEAELRDRYRRLLEGRGLTDPERSMLMDNLAGIEGHIEALTE